MLEHSELLVRRMDSGWDIVEPDTGRPLGIVRPRLVHSRWGLGWLKRTAFDVYESEDEPLVFTVRQLWAFAPKWEICDADGHRVAFVKRGQILDAFGRPWATLESTADSIEFRAGDRQFALARHTAGGLHIDFAADLQDHPLTKMSLFGAGLAKS